MIANDNPVTDTATAEELPLFAATAPRSPSDPVDVIEDDLEAWEQVCRIADAEPRLRREEGRLRSLGRDLQALRDCFLATRHPRIRSALLDEAEAVSRRMRQHARRLRIRGPEIRVVQARSDGRRAA